MKVSGIGGVQSGVSYSPLSRLDYLKSWATQQITQARARNENSIEFVVNETKNAQKLIEYLSKNFQVSTEPSKSVKVKVQF